jgi:predicted XRE-type DNA-binding protein
MASRLRIEESSENLYEDFGFPNPGLEQAKAELAREIRSVIDIRGLTQKQAGDLLGVDQSEVSRITRGRLGRYSLDKLFLLLEKLDRRVEIRVRHAEPLSTASSPIETTLEPAIHGEPIVSEVEVPELVALAH